MCESCSFVWCNYCISLQLMNTNVSDIAPGLIKFAFPETFSSICATVRNLEIMIFSALELLLTVEDLSQKKRYSIEF